MTTSNPCVLCSLLQTMIVTLHPHNPEPCHYLGGAPAVVLYATAGDKAQEIHLTHDHTQAVFPGTFHEDKGRQFTPCDVCQVRLRLMSVKEDGI